MNELIKQKALESGLIYPVPPATDEPLPHYVNAINTFAALIVQECADIFGQEGSGKYQVDGNWISKRIKQHFGVE